MWLAIAGISGALAVAAGAFGAHGLEGRLGPAEMNAFATGAEYHLVHSAALLAVALFLRSAAAPPKAVTAAAWAFLAGIVLFSGSLYFLGLTGSRALVLVTPLGGLAFIAGWTALAWAGVTGSRR